MSKVIEARCANCAAWAEVPPQGPVEIGAPRRGVCNMFPPVPVPQFHPSGKLVGQGHLRPLPMEHEMCMHFVPREPALPPVAN